MLGKIVRDRVPRRARLDISVKLRPDPRIIVERPHADRHFPTIRPFAAKQAGAAPAAKGLHGPLAFPVNADQFLALDEMELSFPHARLRANRSSRMLATTIAVAMACPDKRRFDFETHSAAKATAANHFRHTTPFARPRREGNPEEPESSCQDLACRSRCAAAYSRRSSDPQWLRLQNTGPHL